jgi:23S rRNA pseudouridine1911/1915/1917 synthase
VKRLAFEVTPDEDGRRLDHLLAERVPEKSRSALGRLIRAGHVRVDGARVKAGHLLRPGMRVELELVSTPPPTARPEALPLDIIHEDAAILVLSKQPGMVVHPAPGHAGGTLVNALLAHLGSLPESDDSLKPGIVHRLDRDTSGVLVVAKTELALASLQSQFTERVVRKTYLALVLGTPRLRAGSIDANIGRSRRDRTRMAALRSGGRQAVTHWRVRESWPGTALLEVNPVTGRTHQIRVHLALAGWPVVGDRVYGGGRRPRGLDRVLAEAVAGFPRQALHALSLDFDHPESGRRVSFEAPVPPDMSALLQSLREGEGAGD